MKIMLVAIALAALAGACADVAGSTASGLRHGSSHTTDDDDDDTAPTAAAAAATDTSTTLPTPAETKAAPIVNPFANAPAFAAGTPSKQSADHHGGTSNAGKNCLACHGADMGAPEFLLAGTIPATAGVEVRVVDATGNEVATTHTDDSGNFWVPKSGTATLPAAAHVGIRDASGEQKMSASIGVGACNQGGCHSSERPIFLAK